eukprot:TRINITY_DN4895_c0_g1_i1.p1 TRINITY_DN4895_c0_g1~~TRINITY_DN4895_c0_g1_i1.p1  ORF type:complete len:596 (-),score=102.80 TRINITY_DN4895_c0_g1_i1:72-1859(-)
MPIINILRKHLFAELGEEFTDSQFDELCFEFGIELDDVTTEQEMIRKNTGVEIKGASNEVVYKIDIPANRYDLLCLEGLARALRIFRGKEKNPEYRVIHPPTLEKMIVTKPVKGVRPYVVCAILRNLNFTATSYNSFIELQEKLHHNICRQRTLVSIGTHDLDTIKGPFTYEALPPKDIKFAPLNNKTVFDGEKLMEHLKADAHLSPYLHIIKDSPLYPVIYDSNRVVLSLPPIINGDHSKITLNTKNVFIEVTGVDKTKCSIVLDTVTAMFSQYCKDKFTVEAVQIVGDSNENFISPTFFEREVTAKISYINGAIGIKIDPQQIKLLVERMGLPATLLNSDSEVKVKIPPTRSDVIHACDVMEDVAIAYGFNNLKKTTPHTLTTAKQQPLNKLSDALRLEMAMSGYTEILSLSLCSHQENFDFLQHQDDGSKAVVLANPKTQEFQEARISLLVGALKTVKHNRKRKVPIKIFEVSDIVHLNPNTDVGSENKRIVTAVYVNTVVSFEIIHGLVDHIMLVLNAVHRDSPKSSSSKFVYHIEPSDDPTFFPGLRANVVLNKKKIGVFGIVHPDVLKTKSYKIPYPAAALHIEIEHFV